MITYVEATPATRNVNLVAYEQGLRYRLEIHAINLASCEPEFASTLVEAHQRRKELRNMGGYNVAVFAITERGDLDPA